MIIVMRRAPQKTWPMRLGQVQGSRTQLTPQLAKNPAGVDGYAGQQGRMAHSPKGFTIIELMIATSVFSIILLVALAGFTAIGRIFYKGITINQTQNVTNQILTDVTQNIQSAASISFSSTSPHYLSGNGYSYYCIGGTRYTLNLQHQLDTTQAEDYSVGGNFGLVRDQLPGATGCTAPCPTATGCPVGTLSFNHPVEMLSNKMRLMKLDIASVNGQLYNVSVVVAFGDDSAFSDPTDADKIACQGGQAAQAFCSVNRLSTGVYEGLHS